MEIEVGSYRETAIEQTEAIRLTSDIIVYLDASGRDAQLGAAVVAFNGNMEIVESQRIVHAIRQAATEVQTAGAALRLQWVPGHCDNPSNDAADRMAKHAASQANLTPSARFLQWRERSSVATSPLSESRNGGHQKMRSSTED